MSIPVDTIRTETVTIEADNGWLLTGTRFQHPSPAQSAPVVMMSSAAGVPQGYYTNFAQHLIQEGAAAVLTYDYRGMSASAGHRSRWSQLRMFHWAQFDFPACASWLTRRFPGHPLVGMGHSYGGQALGLSGVANMFERYATVATMSGYWRALNTPYRVWFQTQIVARITARLLGHIPKGIGVGEAMPGTIMLDWADWIADPNYWFDKDDVPGLDNFSNVEIPFLSIGINDDPWGTKRAISSFVKHYENAALRQIWVTPDTSGPIGHLGFFRQRHKDDHWNDVTRYLIKGSWPEAAT